MKKQLAKVGNTLKNQQDVSCKADISQITSLTQEAIAAFPLENKFHDVMEAAGVLLQEHDKVRKW